MIFLAFAFGYASCEDVSFAQSACTHARVIVVKQQPKLLACNGSAQAKLGKAEVTQYNSQY